MKKTHCDMHPIPPHLTNFTFIAPPGKEGEVGKLPVMFDRERGAIYSLWVCESFWWRLKFLFRGRIGLVVMGHSHPPVALTVGDPLEAVTVDELETTNKQ